MLPEDSTSAEVQASVSKLVNFITSPHSLFELFTHTWDTVAEQDNHLHCLTSTLQQASIAPHIIAFILSLSKTGETAKRKRVDAVRIYYKWLVWPCDLVTAPPATWSKQLLAQLCKLAQTLCGVDQAKELLEAAVGTRVEDNRAGVTKKRVLICDDVKQAIKSFGGSRYRCIILATLTPS